MGICSGSSSSISIVPNKYTINVEEDNKKDKTNSIPQPQLLKKTNNTIQANTNSTINKNDEIMKKKIQKEEKVNGTKNNKIMFKIQSSQNLMNDGDNLERKLLSHDYKRFIYNY